MKLGQHLCVCLCVCKLSAKQNLLHVISSLYPAFPIFLCCHYQIKQMPKKQLKKLEHLYSWRPYENTLTPALHFQIDSKGISHSLKHTHIFKRSYECYLHHSQDLGERVLCGWDRGQKAEEVMGRGVRQHLEVVGGILKPENAPSQQIQSQGMRCCL